MKNAALESLFKDIYPDNKETIIESLKKLMEDGKVNLNDLIDGWAPIHYAAYHRDMYLLRFLESKGADIAILTSNETDKQNILHLILRQPGCSMRIYALLERFLEETDLELEEQEDLKGNVPYYYFATNAHNELYKVGNQFVMSFPKGHGLKTDIGYYNPNRVFDSCPKGKLEKCIIAAFESKNYGYLHAAYKRFPYFVSPKFKDYLNLYELSANSSKEMIELSAFRFIELGFIKDIKERKAYVVDRYIDTPVNINAQDMEGYTALHYACLNKDMMTCADLIYEGADINCEGYQLLDDDTKKQISVVVNSHKKYEHKKTAAWLYAKTSIHETYGKHSGSKWISLYERLADTDGLEAISMLVAFDDLVEIHVDNDRQTIERIYAGQNQCGLTLSQANEIYIASGATDELTMGIAIHEFTHFACARIWNNRSNPYAKGSQEEAQMQEILSELHLKYKDVETRKEYPKVLMDAFEYKDPNKWISELIARVPEIILTEGRKALSKAPKLLAFFENLCEEARKYVLKKKEEELNKKLDEFKKSKVEQKDEGKEDIEVNAFLTVEHVKTEIDKVTSDLSNLGIISSICSAQSTLLPSMPIAIIASESSLSTKENSSTPVLSHANMNNINAVSQSINNINYIVGTKDKGMSK